MRQWKYSYRYTTKQWAFTFQVDGSSWDIVPDLPGTKKHVETLINLLPDRRSAPEVSTETTVIAFNEKCGDELARLLSLIVYNYEGISLDYVELK